jgi:hypothetical protein
MLNRARSAAGSPPPPQEDAKRIELSVEARYRYHERIGILAGDGKPTDAQKRIAYSEALEYDARR